MTLHKLRRALLAAAIILPLSAAAAEPMPYVTDARVDLVHLLPPPPDAGSVPDMIDMATVQQTQSESSAERREQATRDSNETFDSIFGGVLGDRFSPDREPLTEQLFDRLGATESSVVDAAKKTFARPRPYMASKDVIHPLGKTSKSGSYPSGHTTRATLEAIVLADMVPEKRQQIWARARDYAQSRIVCGVHYPTDIQAGTLSGEAIATTLWSDPQFRQDLQAARAELRAGLGLTTP